VRKRGFTLVELLVTLALIGIAAAVALPFASLTHTRAKEAELRVALRTIRHALDEYKAAADAGLIDKPTGSSGYPRSLEDLVAGVPRSAAAGHTSTPMVFLRRIPRDPFHPDVIAPAVHTWNVRAYGAGAKDYRAGADVFDISSKSDATALDGSKVEDW
jgi:general secretion pathway protein G